MASAGPWRWVQWSWSSWGGREYSLPHLVDPEKLDRHKQPMTACGLSIGRTSVEQTVYECPAGCCDKCRRAWRKDR